MKKPNKKPRQTKLLLGLQKTITFQQKIIEEQKEFTKVLIDKYEDEAEESDFDSDDSDEKPKKKKSSKVVATKKTTVTTAKKDIEEPSNAVKKLRQICKDAGISKATHVFMKYKTNKEREAALSDLLDEYELDVGSSAKEITKVKNKIAMEKDLEGIDPSAIIEGGRRSRNARNNVSYKGLDASDDDEDDDDDDDDDDNNSDSEEEKPKKKQKKVLTKKKPQAAATASIKPFSADSSSDDDE